MVAVVALVAALGFGAFALMRPDAPTAATTPLASTPGPTPVVTTPVVTTPVVTTPVVTTPVTPTERIGLAVLPERSWDTLPEPNSTNPHWVVLQQNTLYGQGVPGTTCPPVPDGFASEELFETFMTETIECQHRGWQPVFEAIGQPLVMPKITFIRGSTQTPCGTGETTFYCGTWDGSHVTIYVNYSLMQETSSFRQLGFFTATHEYAHHVQHQSKILWSGASLASEGAIDTMERSRRLELQASCWTSRIMVVTEATKFNQSDYDQYIAWTRRDLGEVHGSASSNQYWWQRGFYMDQLSGCNTWTVGADLVS